ncbi:hypothetical protein MUNTM_57020 [Mycobacterium sp. MUNTM1]
MLGAAEVGRDQADAVRVRDSVHGDGAAFAGLGAGGGEHDHGNPGYDPGEAAPAAGGFGDEAVEVVRRRAKKRHTHGRRCEAAHRPVKSIRIVERPPGHRVIVTRPPERDKQSKTHPTGHKRH